MMSTKALSPLRLLTLPLLTLIFATSGLGQNDATTDRPAPDKAETENAQPKLFQGKVVFEIAPAGAPATRMIYRAHGPMLRIESPQKPGAIIINNETGEMIVLQPQEKMYLSYTKSFIDKYTMAYGEPAEDVEELDFDLQETDETKELLGYQAKKLVGTEGDRRIEIWATPEISGFVTLSNPVADKEKPFWEKVLGEKDLFPLQITAFENDQKVVQMRASDISTDPQDENLFTPPETFEKWEVPFR